jgi:hypothetical protein
MATRRPSKKQAAKGAIPRKINLSQQDEFRITFTNDKGDELFELIFNPEDASSIEGDPNVTITRCGRARDSMTALTFWDLNL